MITVAAAQLLTTLPVTTGSAGSDARSSDARVSSPALSSGTSAADAKLSAAKDALSRLKAVSASASASPSELAKAKLEALKQRLKMLMMLGGDPRTVAKEAAEIAKQIGAAAKAYADSAGNSDNAAAAEASSDASAAQQAAASAQGAAQAGGDQARAGQDPAEPAAASDPAEPADASKTDAKPDEPPKSDDASADPAKVQTQAKAPDPTKTPAQAVASPALHGAAVAARSRQPDPVIEEARVLEASAKAMAKAALEKLKTQHRENPDAKKEQAELDQGQKDFDAAAKEIYGDTGAPSGGGDPPSSYAADASPAVSSADAPLVSIKA